MTVDLCPVSGRRLGSVYFVEAVGFGAFKIGFTSDLEHRLASLSTSSPADLRLLYSTPGTLANESEMHDRFAAHRIRGEWFRLSVATIRQLAFLAIEIFESEVAAVSPGDVPHRACAALAGVTSLMHRWRALDRAPIASLIVDDLEGR